VRRTAPEPGPRRQPDLAAKLALRQLARRHQHLSADIAELDSLIAALVEAINPDLLAVPGVGPDIAGHLLVTVGDHLHRLRSDAAFAMLCGVAPLPASSGKTNRHRLNRDANCAAVVVL
jgi:transposase